MVSGKVEAGPGPVEGQRRVLEASLTEHVVVGSRKGFSGVLGNIGKVLPEEWALFLASRIFFHILRLLCPHACVLLEFPPCLLAMTLACKSVFRSHFLKMHVIKNSLVKGLVSGKN